MAVALTDYFGWTVAQLIRAMQAAQAEDASGKTRSAVNSGEVGSQSIVQKSTSERIKKLQYGLYEIYLQDPDSTTTVDGVAWEHSLFANFADNQTNEQRAYFGAF
jgi:hypothetical protein